MRLHSKMSRELSIREKYYQSLREDCPNPLDFFRRSETHILHILKNASKISCLENLDAKDEVNTSLGRILRMKLMPYIHIIYSFDDEQFDEQGRSLLNTCRRKTFFLEQALKERLEEVRDSGDEFFNSYSNLLSYLESNN